jgi:hypothetical protein
MFQPTQAPAWPERLPEAHARTPGLGPLGLLGELNAREIEVLLSHPEVRAPCSPHHGKSAA